MAPLMLLDSELPVELVAPSEAVPLHPSNALLITDFSSSCAVAMEEKAKAPVTTIAASEC